MFETFYYVTRCLLQYAMQCDDDGRLVVRDESARSLMNQIQTLIRCMLTIDVRQASSRHNRQRETRRSKAGPIYSFLLLFRYLFFQKANLQQPFLCAWVLVVIRVLLRGSAPQILLLRFFCFPLRSRPPVLEVGSTL
jgi:hypothetical protein